MEEFCYGNCESDQFLEWENCVMVSVIRFLYGRMLSWLMLSGSGMGEFCSGKSYHVLVQ